ncbi:hypothetical protein [Mesorhizobium sp.]|uniref:hypothetical protein n=1 Tax=Mesorhizobium sp. TaxID=1871066 RepID=UPI001205BE33|nr:hypothetical protein [Mesorhizobium sp.]TIL36209.1 MAG: hypothetical protein E5Y85_00855 [Mesorhizobium sp.]
MTDEDAGVNGGVAQQGGFPTGAAPDLADAAHIEPGPENGPTGTQNVDGDEATEAANTPADDDQAETIDPAVAAENARTALTEARPFTKRAVTILAMRTDGSPESNRAVIDWTRDSETRAYMDENGAGEEQLSINTLEGAHWVTPGDYVVRGVKGEHYPVKPDIFHATYDPAPQAFAAEGTHPFTPREISLIAAAAAALTVQEAISNPNFETMYAYVPRGARMRDLIGILDDSPDLPAEAIVKYLDTLPDMPIEAAEALKATYVGMAPWVKAEGERIAAEEEASRPRPASRYEKHGREERVGAKIVDQAEKDRIARNQAGGGGPAIDDAE